MRELSEPLCEREIDHEDRQCETDLNLVCRENHPEDTVITVGGAKIGGSGFAVIAGPCSVESREQICAVARSVAAEGGVLLRGGAFKPRTSPYAFQGLREEGIRLLLEAGKQAGLPVVSELVSETQLPLFEKVDVIQVGARNMQNFELLKLLAKTDKPVLLKRGLAATLDELLFCAEYLMSGGNGQVILCERGIRTFDSATRNTLDLAAVALLKKRTHLPVIVDPSHATGRADLVEPMALAALAAGADGVMIEVHNHPEEALSDGRQSLNPAQFAHLCARIRKALPLLRP